jgi:hypothetical protein
VPTFVMSSEVSRSLGITIGEQGETSSNSNPDRSDSSVGITERLHHGDVLIGFAGSLISPIPGRFEVEGPR